MTELYSVQISEAVFISCILPFILQYWQCSFRNALKSQAAQNELNHKRIARLTAPGESIHPPHPLGSFLHNKLDKVVARQLRRFNILESA